MNRKNEQTVAQQAAEVVDNVADGIRSTAHDVSQSVRNAGQAVQDAGGRAVHAVQDTYQRASDLAHDSVKYGRDQMRACENGFEQRVRDNPRTALLVAAVVGGAIVAWCCKRK